MRHTKTIPTCQKTARREHEDNSDRRERAIVAAEIYLYFVKDFVVDRGRGRLTFPEKKIRREEEEEEFKSRDVY